MTLLIGKNGSGKSNAIEGVELLAQIAHGRPLHEISDVGRGGAFEIRGGLAGCIRQGHDIMSLSFETPAITYTVSIRAIPEPRIVKESLEHGKRTIFTTVAGTKKLTSGVMKIRYVNFARGPNKPTVTLPADRSVLSQYETFVTSDKLAHVRELVSGLRSYLRASFVFDPIPKSMRQYDRIGNHVLGRHGGNLSPVLYALEQGGNIGKAALARILGSIKQLPEEPLTSQGCPRLRSKARSIAACSNSWPVSAVCWA